MGRSVPAPEAKLPQVSAGRGSQAVGFAGDGIFEVLAWCFLDQRGFRRNRQWKTFRSRGKRLGPFSGPWKHKLGR